MEYLDEMALVDINLAFYILITYPSSSPYLITYSPSSPSAIPTILIILLYPYSIPSTLSLYYYLFFYIDIDIRI